MIQVKKMTIKVVALIDNPYLKQNCKLIGIDQSKRQALDVNPKKLQQYSFTRNLQSVGSTTILVINKEIKEAIAGLSQWMLKVL